MVENLRKLLLTAPFQRFVIVTSGGRAYPVASADHADINPMGTQMVIWFDDGSGVTVATRHITAIEKSEDAAAAA